MKAKWHFSALFLLFISFGMFQKQVSVPNQEITLEFVDVLINKKDIENTIAEVKEKLLKVGISNIIINKTNNGTLKISYYSVVHIDNVKEVLIKDNKLVLNQTSEKKEKNQDTFNYNIIIHEITNDIDISNLDHKYVFGFKYNSDRFTTVDYLALAKKLEHYNTDQLFKATYKSSKNNPFTKDRTSYKEPEVRAGPKNFIY